MWANINPSQILSLQTALDQVLNSIPEYFLYIRKDRRFRCTFCYDPATETVKKLCPECLGTGFHATANIAVGHINSGITAGEGAFDEPSGIYTKNTTFCMFPKNVYPAAEDLVFRVGWNVPSNTLSNSNYYLPTEILNFFKIGYVSRYYQTEVIGYNVELVEQNDLLDFYKSLLPKFVNLPISS